MDPRAGRPRSHNPTACCCAGARGNGPGASPPQQSHRCSRCPQKAASGRGVRVSAPARAARPGCWVQAEGGSARGSVVRPFPSSLHLSRGCGAAPQQPFPPAARLEAPAGFLPPTLRCEHRRAAFRRSPWLTAQGFANPATALALYPLVRFTKYLIFSKVWEDFRGALSALRAQRRHRRARHCRAAESNPRRAPLNPSSSAHLCRGVGARLCLRGGNLEGWWPQSPRPGQPPATQHVARGSAPRPRSCRPAGLRHPHPARKAQPWARVRSARRVNA